MKISKRFRERIASLSTGNSNPTFAGGRAPHYDEVSHWFRCLCRVLTVGGYEPLSGVPSVFNREGRDIVRFASVTDPSQEGRVWWTYYRMESGRWEIICYIG